MTARRVILGISGASCLELSLHFIKKFPLDIELLIVPSKHAFTVCKAEKGQNLKNLIIKERKNAQIHENLTSPLASGSFIFESCIILPTSSHTLSCIATGLQDSLLTRIAAICLKEKRKLVLGIREMPLSAILLENMAKLASIGVFIAPPMVGYYSKIDNLDSMHDFIIGRYFDFLGIENSLFNRWEGSNL